MNITKDELYIAVGEAVFNARNDVIFSIENNIEKMVPLTDTPTQVAMKAILIELLESVKREFGRA